MDDAKSLRPAVFLDRDGTLIEDRGHLGDPADVEFLPGAVEALRKLQEHFLLFIVTNQSGIGKGLLTAEDVDRVNAHVVSQLVEAGVHILAVYVCPHCRSDGCVCIKPNPYFLDKAVADFDVDLRRSFVVGDHPHDVELAKWCCDRGFYVCTGHGLKHLDELSGNRAIIVADIDAAAECILCEWSTFPQEGGHPPP